MQKIFFWLLLLFCSGAISAQKRPNILLIVSDDHAYQAISAYGSKLMQTRNIDRIAHGGVIFKNAFVTNSLCGPSRAVILTGKYSHVNGFKDNDHSRFDGSQDSFIKELQKNGYQTSWIGKWHLETTPQGFDFWQVLPGQGSYYNPDFLMMDGSKKRIDGYVSNIIEDISENWLDHRDTRKPFCLVIGHKATHRNWLPDTADLGKFDHQSFPLPHDFFDDYTGRKAASMQDMTIAKTLTMDYDLKIGTNDKADIGLKRMNPAQRKRYDDYYKKIADDFDARKLSGKALTEWKYERYMRDYLSTAIGLERNIGRVLDYLDTHGLSKNTIVIYMSDQGFYMGEHGWFDKRWMYEESFRTPMVMRYPGVVKPGSTCSGLVMNLDIAPTLLDAAGVQIPKDMQGKSFLPLLKKNMPIHDALYYHYYENGTHSVSPHFGVRTKQYKLICFYEKVNSWEFYDLKTDPHEMHNVYGKKEYEPKIALLRKRLKELIDQYGDKEALTILQEDKSL
ncbi:MAG: sulfatase [Bacteroidetes bacterium]|nr:sulfatase [Bacteroidota bacterium]